MKPMKYVKLSLSFLPFIMIFLVYMNCSEIGFKVNKVESSLMSIQCNKINKKVEMAEEVSFVRARSEILTPYTNNKFLLFKPSSPQSKSKEKTGELSSSSMLVDGSSEHGTSSIPFLDDEILPKDFDLIIDMDIRCLNEKRKMNTKETFLTENLKIRSFDEQSNSSSLQTFKVSLPEAISVYALKRLTDSEACLIGLSRRVKSLKMNANLNDSRIGEQNHLGAVNFPSAMDVFFDGTKGIKRDIIVAIIDSGVDYSHPDLKANMWINKNEVALDNIDNDRNAYVDDIYGYDFAGVGDYERSVPDSNPMPFQDSDGSHGTHVAGLVAAVGNNALGVTGIMYKNIKIMALKVVSDIKVVIDNEEKHIIREDWVAEAIRYAADNGAHVVNLSLGTEELVPSIQMAMMEAIQRYNIFFMIAAGNEGNSVFIYPAAYSADIPGVMSIGAVDSISGDRCGFSNYGSSWVDLGAPGCANERSSNTGLLSTFPQSSGEDYFFMSGTSMASPVALGGAALAYALIRERLGDEPYAWEVEEIMKSGAAQKDSLKKSFVSGRVLDLKKLADTVNSVYANGKRPTPPPGVCK